MNRKIVAWPVRTLLGSAVVAVVLVVVTGPVELTGSAVGTLLAPFAAVGVAVAVLGVAAPRMDRLVRRLVPHPVSTAYSALADTAARVRDGTIEDALPGLAQVLGEGTGAQRAAVWLVVDDALVAEAVFPPGEGAGEAVPTLGVLLARSDTDHAVPVLDGAVLRAVLTIGKPGRPVTPADQRLMQDVAGGAGLLLRGVARSAELATRVRRVDELARETAASRRRLHLAREVERRRLVAELGGATADRLAAFRTAVMDAVDALDDTDADDERAEFARHGLESARTRMEDLLDRFRVIARGVYPAVLRDQGPFAALEEVIADLPRTVRLTGRLADRLPWEVESGVYYLAASALRLFAGHAVQRPLGVHLDQVRGTVEVRISEPALVNDPDDVRATLIDDADRLAALGGALEFVVDGSGGAVLRAWLPDHLRPSVDDPVTR